MQVGEGQQVQIVQAAAAQGSAQTAQAQGQTMQVMQQIITNTGEIQQIPVRYGMAHEPGITSGWEDEYTSHFYNLSTKWLISLQATGWLSGVRNGCELCIPVTSTFDLCSNWTLSPPCVDGV